MTPTTRTSQPSGPSQDALDRFARIVDDLGPVDMTPGTAPAPWAELAPGGDLPLVDEIVTTPPPTSATD